MKKSFLIISALIVIMAQAIVPVESKPKKKKSQPPPPKVVVAPRPAGPKNVQVKLGLSMAYDWWMPAFIKLENGMTGTVTAKNMRTSFGGSFMMGPVLGIKVGSAWNIGLSALIGLSKDKFKHTTQAVDQNLLYMTIPQNMFSAYIEDGMSRTRRYEADAAVEYSFHKYFSLLFGASFRYIDGDGSSVRLSTLFFPISSTKIEYNAWYVGPSIGIGFYYEIRGFSIKAGISALIQGGTYYCRNSFRSPLYGIYAFAFIPDEFAVAYLAMGGAGDLRFAYFVERIRVEFWIGGRYAVLPHISLYDAGSAYNGKYKKGWITGELEQYGGINFGAAYKF
jgi:hypothetical protein